MEQENRMYEPYCSDPCNDLYAALAKAQAEFTIAGLNNKNPYFKSKYADHKDIVEAARPALAKYQLAFVQPLMVHEDGTHVLYTRVTHSSGQWIHSKVRVVPPKSDIQSFGSMITYLKRYCLASLLGIVAGDEDDDGEKAMQRNGKEVGRVPIAQDTKTISQDQLEQLHTLLENEKALAQEIMAGLKIQSLSHMPTAMFMKAINHIHKVKKNR